MPNKPPLALAGLRILVVEDEYMVAELLCIHLERFGCTVIGPFADVDGAVAAVHEHHLDGALLDANLNGLSSAPVAEALSAASVPFVLATGYGGLALSEAILNRAPRVNKPFIGAELKAVMEAVFRPD